MIFDVGKEISHLTQQIIEKYKPKKVILFGSAARGEWTPDSDADFLIIKDETPLLGADRIREISRIIDRNISVDFLIYRPEEFRSPPSRRSSVFARNPRKQRPRRAVEFLDP